jgi:hypothetical protein
MRDVSRLCEFYPGICLTTEEKARKNLSQGKKNLSQVKKNLKVQYSYYQKHPHITKPSQTHRLQNPLIHIRACTHTIKQYKTTTIQIKTKCIYEKHHNGEKEQYLVSTVVNSF